MEYRCTNDFYAVDHPLVSALLKSELTLDLFVESVAPTDPFLFQPDPRDKNVISCMGYPADVLKTMKQAVELSRITLFRSHYGFGSLKDLLSYETDFTANYPSPTLASTFDTVKKEFGKPAGCSSCQENGLFHKLISVLAPLIAEDGSKLPATIPDPQRRLLQKETVTDEELSAYLPPHSEHNSKILQMAEFPRIVRPSFFDSTLCGRGSNQENCQLCRNSKEHRVKINKEYQIPLIFDTDVDGTTVSVQTAAAPTFIEDFDCPYAQHVAVKYPSLLTQAKNLFGAMQRVVRAKRDGQVIRTNMPEAAARRKICEACGWLDHAQYRCTQCGCFIAAKQALSTEHCPIGKWPNDVSMEVTVPVEKKPLEFPTVQPTGKQAILFSNGQAVGDIVVMTGAIRDFVKAHGNKYRVNVTTPFPELWEAHEYIDKTVSKSTAGVKQVKIGYDWVINQSNQTPYHFMHGFHIDIADKLDMPWFPVTEFGGHVPLTKEEMTWVSMIEEHYTKVDSPFWLIVNGGKPDYTTKHWITEYAQQVVAHYKNRIQFVQVGARIDGHMHHDLKGVINLVGETSLRMLVRLVYHAQGVLCPITGVMHLAAAVPTKDKDPKKRACVTICGGREPHQFIDYANHQTLHTNGMLPCCDNGGCWKSRTTPVNDGDRKDKELCVDTIDLYGRKVQRCMALITAPMVIRAIDGYMQHPKRHELPAYGLKTLDMVGLPKRK